MRVNVKRSRARSGRSRRRYRKTRMSVRSAKIVNNRLQKYFFTRKCDYTQIYPTALGVKRTLSFGLSDLPNYTEFTNLFDQYKINAIKLTFIPRFTGADINPLGTALAVPRIWSVIDYDDASTLTDQNDAYQYQNCKTHMMHKPFSIYLKPKVAAEVYQSTIATGYGAKRMYIDCSVPSVPHYGVKLYVEPTPYDGQFTVSVIAKFYLSMKQVR